MTARPGAKLPPPRRDSDEDLPPAVAWAARILWPEAQVWRTSGRRAGPHGFLVLPNAQNPRILVPTRPTRAAAAALRQYNDSMTQWGRLRKAAAASAVGAGIGSSLARDAIVIRERDGDAQPGLGPALAEAFGRRDLSLAIMLGTPRPNRKPVIQVTDPDGDVLGYVKVGWNELTRRLVSNEARALRAWAARQPSRLAVPRLLHEFRWNDLLLTAVSPVRDRAWRRGPRNAPPPPDVMREVTDLGGLSEGPLRGSPYLEGLRARIEAVVRPPFSAPARAALARAGDTASAEHMRFGTWHGDWAPWNMSRSSGSLFVWDWERSADASPVGLDPLHFHYQVTFQFGGKDVARAARSATSRAAAELGSLDLDPSTSPVLLTVYLLELLVRFEEGRVGGAPDGTDVQMGLTRMLLELGEAV